MSRESDLKNWKRTERSLAGNSNLVILPSGTAKFLNYFERKKLTESCRQEIENLSPKISQ